MNFFSELKRRNVFRVGIAYAVAAWVLLQVVDLVLENIAAPDWVMKVFMLAVAIGFPVAVIIAWAFEMTSEGIKRESDVDRSQSIVSSTGRKLDRIIIGFLALAVVLLAIDPFGDDSDPASVVEKPATAISTPSSAETAQRDSSVAVLPFAFRSANAEDEFFAEGMHDDLLTQLAKIGSLKVISRTSVMEYKDTTKKIPEIAAELGVATIVEGGVQRSGTRIRFNAQLIDAKTDEHLWAETYNRELTAENLFDIQAEIAKAIAQALHATLSPEEEASIERALTNNLKAWESYQRAIRLRQVASADNIKIGLSEANRALELDPDFAAAWSLKAIFLMQSFWFYDTDPAIRAAAWDAIQHGRSINPTLAELDLAEGFYYYWGFRDYAKALPFMQKASAALPGSSRIHTARAFVLRRMGDWENTLQAFRRASELDPRNSESLTELGATLSGLRRFDEARLALESGIDVGGIEFVNNWELSNIHLNENGDVEHYFFLLHLTNAPYLDAQLDKWLSSLYLDDYEAAMLDVTDWPESFLVSKDLRVTRPMLEGLTHLYAGNPEIARPLLANELPVFESLLEENPDDFSILRSLCLMSGALGETAKAQQYCKVSLLAAPDDRYVMGLFRLDAAAGLALAGDAQGSIKLLTEMLLDDAGPTIYPVMYHPAFDGIREHPTYTEFMNQYGPDDGLKGEK